MKTKTSRFTISTEESTNNGKLSTLINTQRSQSRENSTLISDYTLKEISMLFLNYKKEDTSTLSTTETWLSRLQMVEIHRDGTLTKRP